MAEGDAPHGDEPSLRDELSRHQLEFEDQQVDAMEAYRLLLCQWNEKLNLTRHTTAEKFVTRDILDSWELAKLIDRRERVLDVGTGGGVPGVLLAIMRPDLRVSLCDSTGKKAKAVEAIVGELGLKIPVYYTRAEEVLAVRPFDVGTVRAVAPLPKLLRWFGESWQNLGRLLITKGPKWVEERGESRHLGLLRKLDLRIASHYETPESGAQNIILRISPKDELDL